jgi:hypothetical protein
MSTVSVHGYFSEQIDADDLLVVTGEDAHSSRRGMETKIVMRFCTLRVGSTSSGAAVSW